MVLAVLIPGAIVAGASTATSVLLTVAWASDFLDGRMARAGAGSRLGRWDVIADVMVGAGAALGLGLSGAFPMWLVVAR
jgi:phosphatidylglycerophosphate synthase